MANACAEAKSGSFFDKLKQYWRELKTAPHGRRFRTFYDLRKCARKGNASRILPICFALGLVVFGLAIGWLPGPGGFVAILGLALLAQEFRPLASALDWCERQIGNLWRGFRSLPILGQGGIITALLVLGCGVAYLTFTTVIS